MWAGNGGEEDDELVEWIWELGEWKRGVEEEMKSHFRAVED